MHKVEPRRVEIYETESGDAPYEIWFDGIRDAKTQGRIKARIARVRLGNLGDCDAVGDGVSELVLDFGPGYRIYFAQVDKVIVLLLCGGDKSTQKTDIATAKKHWADYQARCRKEIAVYAQTNEKLYRSPVGETENP